MGEPEHDDEPAPRGEPDNWTDVDVDAAFAAIVAQFGQTGPRVGPWSATEDVESPDAGTDAAAQHDTEENPEGVGRTQAQSPETRSPETAVGRSHPEPDGPPGSPDDSAASDRTPTSDHTQVAPAPTDADTAPAGSSGSRHAEEPDAPVDDRHDRHDRHYPDDIDYPEDSDDPDDEDRFIPPAPPPLPRGDFLTTFAWVCVLGGPLFLLVAALAWTDMPGELILAAVAAFIGGFVLLIARMPGERPDDPDDGAVV